MKKVNAHKAFLADQRFDAEETLIDGLQYTAHLPGVLRYLEGSLVDTSLQLRGLRVLFSGFNGPNMVEPSEIAAIADLLSPIIFELEKCQSAVADEATELVTRPKIVSERLV